MIYSLLQPPFPRLQAQQIFSIAVVEFRRSREPWVCALSLAPASQLLGNRAGQRPRLNTRAMEPALLLGGGRDPAGGARGAAARPGGLGAGAGGQASQPGLIHTRPFPLPFFPFSP